MLAKIKRDKNEKGFTIIELLFSITIFMMVFVGTMTVIFKKNERERIDELAYTTAQIMATLAGPAKEYIDDNIVSGLPNSFTSQTLIDNGYIDSDPNINFDVTPLGRQLRFYVNNDNGFPLSIAMYETGAPDKDVMARYNLDKDINHINYQRRVSTYLKNMVVGKNYDIGIVDNEYYMDNASSTNRFPLEPFIKKEMTNISEELSTALFFTMQENPGFWVINVSTRAYKDNGVASANRDTNKMYSIGYSDFCPSPSIIPSTALDTTPISPSVRSAATGDYTQNAYICIPASELVVEENSYEIPLLNDYHEMVSYSGDCKIRNAVSNIVEFQIGTRYFTFLNQTGRVDLTCYRAFIPNFSARRIGIGRLSGSTGDIDVNYAGRYTSSINNIAINRVELKR